MRFIAPFLLLAAMACGSFGPVAGAPLTEPELKFKVMDAAGKPVWCDPDFYPLGHDPRPSAIAKYPEIKADTKTYAAIVAHEHLPSSGELTDEQKLVLYQAWKLLRPVQLKKSGDGFTFEYTVVATAGGYQLVAGHVSSAGPVSIDSRKPWHQPMCPICLASWTMIDTPSGPVRVTEIRVGTLVWTQAAGGSRVAAPVVRLGSMEAPAGHQVVHVLLADGRSLDVSPGHRTADGRAFGSLAGGDPLDGSTVRSAALVPYSSDRTYDLLPAGPTGRYWAGGILVSSTLG